MQNYTDNDTCMTPRVHSIFKFQHTCFTLLSFLFIPLLIVSCSKKENNSTIVSGKARFEFLTPSMVRMEYAPSGKFINARTVVIQKRQWPLVKVNVTRKKGWLIAKTGKLTLRYHLNSGNFKSGNLAVSWQNPKGSHTWHPGDKDSLNLGGMTISPLNHGIAYSLDNAHKGAIPKAQPGLLSRNGYAFINDSHSPVWDSKTQWIKPREQKNDQDWYLITYSNQYKKALNDFAELSGPIPMIPRYTLGPWITDLNFEYFPNSYQSKQPYFKKYNEQHLKNEILRFRQNKIPLDILVMDFGWHNYGWEGGYDWSPLIPKPKQFLVWLHQHGIKVSVNDHPGYDGQNESDLSYSDSKTPEVLKDLGKSMPEKPSFDLNIAKGWKFKTDPHNLGISHNWYSGNYNDSRWKSIKVGTSWMQQGYKNYKGVAWYRRSVNLPTNLPDSLYFYLGYVNGSIELFINGHEITHFKTPYKSAPPYADITSYVKAGGDNVIAIRVSSKRGGGITGRPTTIENAKPPPRIHFDLSNKKQALVFMRDLHKPLMQEGVNFWWIDGGSGAVSMPGLSKQLWTNRVYYDYTKKETGKRAFIFSRDGGWGSQRYPAFFTGDTHSQWAVLAYEVRFTAQGGNTLMPYITNDIGGYHGAKIPFDMYARWVEFGSFSPILRLHSAHENPKQGNLRMPWKYGQNGMALIKKYFTLRTELIPYIYTYTRLAHTESMPLLRPLYLQYPNLSEAYDHPHEYFFGKEMLVAPVIDSTGSRSIYLPPGKWINYFTGAKLSGDTTITKQVPINQIPVFVRSGSIIPEQPDMAYSNAKPLDELILNIYGKEDGHFNLYEDDGVTFDYKQGQYAWTPMTYSSDNGTHTIVIDPVKGSFTGQVQSRSYDLRVRDINRPTSVMVDGSAFKNWTWNERESLAEIHIPKQSIRKEVTITLK